MAIKGFQHKDLEQFFATGTWAVNVSGNWRVTFGFTGKDAERVDYEDYH